MLAVVKFGVRGPLGSVSEKLFMAHATHGASAKTFASQSPELRNSVHKILCISAGLPIAPAVMGSAVAFLSSTLGDFGTACDEYATHLEKKRGNLAMRTRWRV